MVENMTALTGKSRSTIWRFFRQLDDERRRQGLPPLFSRDNPRGWWRVNIALLMSSPHRNEALLDRMRDLEREVGTLRRRLVALGDRVREIEEESHGRPQI